MGFCAPKKEAPESSQLSSAESVSHQTLHLQAP